MLHAERDDTEAHHDARVWPPCRGPIESPSAWPERVGHRTVSTTGGFVTHSTGREGSIGKTLRKKIAALATVRIGRVARVTTGRLCGIR